MARRRIATALGFLPFVLVVSVAPLRGASADESADDLGVPPVPSADERMAPAQPTETAPMTQTADPTIAPVEPSAPAPPPIMSEPIETVQRPSGPWGPVAVAADLLVMRPLGFVSLAAGGAAFVIVSPVAAATGTLQDRADTLMDRVENVFTRPLGAL